MVSRILDGQGIQLILSVDCGTVRQIKAVPHHIANFKFGRMWLWLKGGKTEKRAKALSAKSSGSGIPPTPVDFLQLDCPSMSAFG